MLATEELDDADDEEEEEDTAPKLPLWALCWELLSTKVLEAFNSCVDTDAENAARGGCFPPCCALYTPLEEDVRCIQLDLSSSTLHSTKGYLVIIYGWYIR